MKYGIVFTPQGTDESYRGRVCVEKSGSINDPFIPFVRDTFEAAKLQADDWNRDGVITHIYGVVQLTPAICKGYRKLKDEYRYFGSTLT